LLEFPNLAIGGVGSVRVVERLVEEVEECVQGFEPDLSSIFRYIGANQIEGGPQEAVDRISEAPLVVGVMMGLHSQLVAQLDNPGAQFFDLTACNTRVFHQRHNRPGGHQQSITLERATLV